MKSSSSSCSFSRWGQTPPPVSLLSSPIQKKNRRGGGRQHLGGGGGGGGGGGTSYKWSVFDFVLSWNSTMRSISAASPPLSRSSTTFTRSFGAASLRSLLHLPTPTPFSGSVRPRCQVLDDSVDFFQVHGDEHHVNIEHDSLHSSSQTHPWLFQSSLGAFSEPHVTTSIGTG